MNRPFDENRIASLRIERELDPTNPREFTSLGTMACWHQRMALGDVQLKEPLNSWVKNNAPKGSLILPLYIYDHSGVTMRTTPFGDPWDSGQVGVIAATPDKIRKHLEVKRLTKKVLDTCKKILEEEVRIYDYYLQGMVWNYELIDCEGESRFCSDFYGSTLEETGIERSLPFDAIHLLQDAWENKKW